MLNKGGHGQWTRLHATNGFMDVMPSGFQLCQIEWFPICLGQVIVERRGNGEIGHGSNKEEEGGGEISTSVRQGCY